MGKVVLGLLAVALLAVGGIFAASELGGEVATLYTRDSTGREYQTSVWIVEDGGKLWLRAGRPDSRWLKRLVETPEVRLQRGDAVAEYRASVQREQRERINRLMAERYGWADQLVGLLHDSETVTPVRLDRSRR